MTPGIEDPTLLVPLLDDLSLPALREAHRRLHAGLASELEALPADVFDAPQGEHWSPAQHLDHLVRSVTPLVGALGVHRWALRLRFGRPVGPRPFPSVVDGYLGKLARGGGARGRYLPTEPPETGADPVAVREKLLDCWTKLGRDLDGRLSRWRDRHLDRANLPHPLIGLLTVREMVAWSWYHGEHHRARIRERVEPPVADA